MLIESSILLIAFFLMLIVSNIINRLYPKIPLPFIQIVLGILVGVLARESTLTLNSELFLALVIGPLNFCEGQESDVMTFVKYKSILAYLILPTVFITMLTVGYVTGKLLPVDIPLAASFALGAALAPTDAVAFLSIAKRFKFPKRVESILTLEGLLNDASGLISFEFAVALPDDAAVFVRGMPHLAAVKPTAAAADEFSRKAACAVMRTACLLPSRQLILRHVKDLWLDDGRMAVLDIILRYLAFIDLHLFCEKVRAESLLQQGVALVFLIGEDA